MEKLDIVSSLEGGMAYDIKFDLFLHRVIFYIKMPFQYRVEFYELILEKVYDFKFLNEYKDSPWNYIEISLISVENQENSYLFFIEMWSSELEIKCENYEIKKTNIINIDSSDIEYERQ